MKINWGPDRLNYERIRQIADNFLEKYNPDNIIPLDIEYIAEFDMNLTITPLPNIELLLDVDSFISNDLKKIHIDENIFKFEQRARFSIAHEIGHIILHDTLFKNVKFNTIEEWQELLKNFNAEEYRWCEYQARSFAGLILVPINTS